MMRARTVLVEWWGERSDRGEHTGRWFEGDGSAARDHALTVVDQAWTGRVRISLLDDGQPVAAIETDGAALLAWDPDAEPLPAPLDGLPLPPRSPDDVRREIVCGCRDALALGLRSGLLGRRRVVDLLHEIDRSFDPGLLDEDDE